MEVTREDFDYSAFGSRLKEAREKAGLTQAQACEAVGIPKAQVLSSYERGISNPPIDTLAALARTYGVSLDDLIFDEDKPQKHMTTGDWLFLLVRAADHLIISPRPADERHSAFVLKHIATGELSWGENSIYGDFFNKWKKLLDARIDKVIDDDDYFHLVRRHANQVPDDPNYEQLHAFYKKEGSDSDTDSEPTVKRMLSRFLDLISSYSDLDED